MAGKRGGRVIIYVLAIVSAPGLSGCPSAKAPSKVTSTGSNSSTTFSSNSTQGNAAGSGATGPFLQPIKSGGIINPTASLNFEPATMPNYDQTSDQIPFQWFPSKASGGTTVAT